MITPGQCRKNMVASVLACTTLIFVASAAGQTPRAAEAAGGKAQYLQTRSAAEAAMRHATEVARGKQLYFINGCYACHGYNGETGPGAHLAGSPMLKSAETFISYLRLRANYKPLGPSERMPSFAASDLSDAEARDIYAYVRTFVLDAPNPQGIAAFQKILESATHTYKPPP